MGKPTTQLSRRASTQSVHTAPSKNNMNIPPITSQKSLRAKLKQRKRTDETIKKLFSQLRRDSKSQQSIDSQSCEASVIEIDDSSLNNTDKLNISVDARVPDVTGSVTEAVNSGNMITVSNNLNIPAYRRSKVNSVIIKDDDPTPSISTPRKNIYSLHHSTPIKQKPSLDELIISVNNQLLGEDSNNNKTREINASSFLTIDLTTDTGFNRSTQPTVINLDDTNEPPDCVLTSVSQGSSMSGDSDVTVLRRPERKRSIASQIKRGLVNLNTREKDKLLAYISENLFSGCSVPGKIQPRAPITAEDTYIKNMIVRRKLSRNSIGSNVYNPEEYVNTTGLRMVVIDGSNVAMAHGHHRHFSVPGLQIAIDYFLSRGHAVKAFVPRFRNKMGQSSHPQVLIQLEREGHLIFTPSREVHGKIVSSYDDRYIIQCAAAFEGVIVSNDKFTDLIRENTRWEHVINNRVLPYNWVNGMIMFPRDPLGRNGPTLEEFLKMDRNTKK